MAGVKISGDCGGCGLSPGSVTSRDRERRCDIEIAGAVRSSRDGFCECSKISRELNRERTVRRVFSSPTRALKTPAGTVLLEVGFLKSNGIGARFVLVGAIDGNVFGMSRASSSFLGDSTSPPATGCLAPGISISCTSPLSGKARVGNPEYVRGCRGPPLILTSFDPDVHGDVGAERRFRGVSPNEGNLNEAMFSLPLSSPS
jgi:hypothetical protein